MKKTILTSKKNILAIILSMVMLIGLLPVGVAAEEEAACATIAVDGGEASEPMTLSQALTQASTAPANSVIAVALIDDAVLSNWTPININNSITFTLEGNGHEIRGLDTMLFGTINSGGVEKVAIRNLSIAAPSITGDYWGATGAIVGWHETHMAEDSLTIENCHITVITDESGRTAGGSITADGYVGGFVGYSSNASTLTIKGCSVESLTLSAGNSVGMLVGHVNNVTIEECEIKGTNELICTDEGGTRSDKVGIVVGRVNGGEGQLEATVTGTTSLSPEGTYSQRIVGSLPSASLEVTDGLYPSNPLECEKMNASAPTAPESFTFIENAVGCWEVGKELTEGDVYNGFTVPADITISIPRSLLDEVVADADAITLPEGSIITANGQNIPLIDGPASMDSNGDIAADGIIVIGGVVNPDGTITLDGGDVVGDVVIPDGTILNLPIDQLSGLTKA